MSPLTENCEANDGDWLVECVEGIRDARVGVFGDFCLDAYWELEAGEEELSIETGLGVRRVRSQRYSLGGAGNVVANLKAIGVGEIVAMGVVGDDLFGHEMLRLFEGIGVGSDRMLIGENGWQTLVYAKPYVEGVEESRFDFGAFNRCEAALLDALEAGLDEVAGACDIVILNQQVPNGIGGGAMIERINGVIRRRRECLFLVDSRHCALEYKGALLKMNEEELARYVGEDENSDVMINSDRLRGRGGQDVFVTCGADGIAVSQADGARMVKGIELSGPVDTVGAGDTVTAAIAGCLGAGIDAYVAGRFANLAASVTVQKLRTTGVASPMEILEASDALND